jgi:hypothetical protein
MPRRRILATGLSELFFPRQISKTRIFLNFSPKKSNSKFQNPGRKSARKIWPSGCFWGQGRVLLTSAQLSLSIFPRVPFAGDHQDIEGTPGLDRRARAVRR